MGSTALDITHIFRVANTTADWMASFVAEHFEDVLWIDLGVAPRSLCVILFSDPFGLCSC